jgi:hypothetical protein
VELDSLFHEHRENIPLVVRWYSSIPNAGNASSSHPRSVSSAGEQLLYTEKVGGSIPSRTTRGYSSVGRAPALQAGCRQFDSGYLHHFRTNSRSKWLPTVNDSKMLGDPINPNHRLHLVKILKHVVDGPELRNHPSNHRLLVNPMLCAWLLVTLLSCRNLI